MNASVKAVTERVAAAPAPAAAARRAPAQAPRLQGPLLWSLAVTALIVWGMHAHLERYISPQRGLGYWLGIVGGSMMVLLLLYSARKRAAWLRWLGGIPAWFEIHMVLGVIGPILVLFHSNFSLGATNSNVALISMLLVAGSGVIGRYIYTRLHARLDGHEITLEQLRAVGERLHSQTASLEILPGLLAAIDQVEKRYIAPPKGLVARWLHLFTGALRTLVARWVMRKAIKTATRLALMRSSDSREARIVALHAQRMAGVARQYAYRRLDAGRRTTEYKMYAQLFSLWHVLHIPLFFMLLVAGIVHVIAVNVY